MFDVSTGTEFALLAKCLLQSQGNAISGALLADNAGAPGRRVSAILKAAVGGGSISNPTWAGALADYQQVAAGFIETLRSRSVFVRLLSEGIRRVPLRTALAVSTATITATILAEGGAKPLSKLTLAGPTLDPMKAAALIVITGELLRSTQPAGIALLNTELRNGVSAAIDGQFFDTVIDGSTPTTASTGITAAQITADLRALLNAVNTTGAGALFWASSAGVANGLATVTGTSGELAFPTVTPTGGELLGQPLLVTDQTGAADNLVLIDASGIAGEMDTIILKESGQAALQMVDNPVNSPTAAQMVSLFQTNSRALMAESYFGVERFRSNAVAVLTGIDWTP